MAKAVVIRWLISLLLFLALSGQADEFLDPAVAFRPTARAVDERTIEVRFAIAKGYYLYRDKFRFALDPTSVPFEPPTLPPGKAKDDETFGRVEVYYDEVLFRLPVTRTSSGSLPLTLKLSSQGCADAGVCYPPQQHRLTVQLPDAVVEGSPSAGGTDRRPMNDESGRIARLFQHAGFWLLAASFFGFGLLLSLTPCVFPMIPIVSSIIVGAGRDGHGVSHLRGFSLSLAYVLGMALTYAVAGVLAGLSGTLLSSALQNPWVIGSFAAIFVVLALSMFGFFELQLPTFVQSKVSDEARQLRGGSLPGVALMGALSAVIVGPCVAAPLAGALLYIGQTGDALLGGAALFAMGLGMGAPLLAVGVSAGTLLPKSGAWMEAIKKTFGVILLATALWLVSPLLPGVVGMLAWALLLIVSASYLHALDPLPVHARGWQRFWKGIGIVLLLCGAALLLGALAGSRDPLQPLSVLRNGASGGETRPLPFVRVGSVDEVAARVKSAQRPVMLDFYADWCVTCKEMERTTFADPRVQAELARWTLLQADVTRNSEQDQALLQRFKVYGPPAIIFFDRSGKEIEGVRIVGLQGADEFLGLLASLRE
ncbi:MAG TPA: protein-disulfide reductase DsbD [Accumulibacter sp.]|uniref:protein-disulfide reductase DsbD n=1 Tax=Accumulibacter sp. TaxID=2053492 RepID=UPI002BB2B61F|nr:protein-disulfide reductase DsbD [Accumulibacter sp.]HMX67499.1 protein-disulfide reductase DsbD [Accumulibacter sp.]HNG86629.1 protein-disulfide reductase DsbD [Accumulibacter sp.]